MGVVPFETSTTQYDKQQGWQSRLQNKMESTSVVRIAILGFALLGIIFTITAIAGDEWEVVKRKTSLVTVKVTVSLWKVCEKVEAVEAVTTCSNIDYDKYPKNMKRKFFKITLK